MSYRFLKTLKTTEMLTSPGTYRLPPYTSTTAACLFIRRLDDLDETERADLTAFRLLHPSLDTTYHQVQDFLQMMWQREGERLDTWLIHVRQSHLPELESFSHGVEQDKASVQAGLTLQITNGQVEGRVTRIKRDFANDVWQSWICTPASTHSSPHLKTAIIGHMPPDSG